MAIITIGSEILAGHTLDTNFLTLARGLSGIGLEVQRHLTVGDRPDEIRCAVESSMREADLVVVTGGLGGTPDDLTLDVVCGLLGYEIVADEERVARFEAAYQKRGQSLPEAARRIARTPKDAVRLPNPVGQAFGIWFDAPEAIVVLLPGIPAEMEGILTTELIPRLSEMTSGKTAFLFRIVGIGEGHLSESLSARGVTGLSFLPSAGRVDIRMVVPATDPLPDDAKRAVDAIREVAGPALYAEEEITLEEIVGRELTRRQETLAVAESLTGGYAGGAITRVPGASAYFLASAVTYSDESKREWLSVSAGTLERHGAVSAEVAAEMATGVRARAGSDWALATTGIAGPTGDTPTKPIGRVYIGLAYPDGSVHTSGWLFPGRRHGITRRAVIIALDQLRRALLGLPLAEGNR